MIDDSSAEASWPSPEEYGQRFSELDEKLGRFFAYSEYRGESAEDAAVLRYRLAKLAIAAEDIRRAISVLESTSATDAWIAQALVELRGACTEVNDSFSDVDARIIRFLNFLDE